MIFKKKQVRLQLKKMCFKAHVGKESEVLLFATYKTNHVSKHVFI